MPAPRALPGLAKLARLYGVQSFYYDIANQRQAASPEALLALLRALGAPIEGAAELADALRWRRESEWRTPAEPVHLAWDGRALPLELRLPAERADARATCSLALEDGDARVWTARLAELGVEADVDLGGHRFVAKRLPLPSPLPPGYHRLRVEGIGPDAETLVVSAPRYAYGADTRAWGVFLPLYALRSRRSLGVGDLTDLRDLARWAGGLGAASVGTLPLLAAFLGAGDEPFEPSPYAPASRLFWNELYLDLERLPGLERAPEARRLLADPVFRREARREADGALVDYRRAAALKRQVLEHVAGTFDPADPTLARYAAAHPRLEEYARFRAVTRRQGAGWHDWPARLRDGHIGPRDVDAAEVRYHVYAQWALHEQLSELSGRAGRVGAAPFAFETERPDGRRRERGPGRRARSRSGSGQRLEPAAAAAAAAATDGPDRADRAADAEERSAALYLDMPLGVNKDGYDIWAHRDLFPDGISAGAPPDSLFGGGQDWGFPPMHPEVLRRTGYRYFIDVLRTVMPFAGTLRFDHVMSLHRLYWIPPGFGATQGTYVRYHADEYYAILALESHRHRTRIVGEDLGTVPQEVRASMGRHHIGRMYVLQYEAVPTERPPVHAVPPDAVASLNTHDMPPFAGFWEGADIDDRIDLGLLDERGQRGEMRERRKLERAIARFLATGGWLEGAVDEPAVLRAALDYLAGSDAGLVLASLEDLWGETRPQNVPGTLAERPNWRRRARLTLEQMRGDLAVEGLLREIDRIRRDSRSPHG
jgi:4-alpha-glucanotransferase